MAKQIPINKTTFWEVHKFNMVVKKGFATARDAHDWASKNLDGKYQVIKPSWSLYY